MSDSPRLKYKRAEESEPEPADDLLDIADKLSHEETSEVLKPLTPNFYYSEK